MSKREIEIHLHRLSKQCSNLDDQICGLENLVDGRIKQLRKTLSSLRLLEDQLSNAVDAYKVAADKESKTRVRELERRIEELEKRGPVEIKEKLDTAGLSQAKTLAIFDAILFAISNWANDGDTAPDIELACQSVLFPTIYERVMAGQSDYLVERVPVVSLEIVKRGREFILSIRQRTDQSLTRQEIWDEYAPEVQQWWVNDALPLIYGARDPDWDHDTPLSLTEVIEWRDHPASRALHFPLIFDGFELVSKFRDEIRDTTGLPEFNRDTIDTRLSNPL